MLVVATTRKFAMETFKIEVREFLSKIVEIEAANIDDAVATVKQLYEQNEIVLDGDNYVVTEIEMFPD
ncbi:MAG: DpnD/PcfM-like protein [Burkholderiaceae bacterium]|nr:DpnD/PcfM-like protein [Burkholderiaceae bacterium]